MSARDGIVEIDAAWLEQRQAWLTVALHRAQKAREESKRAAPFSADVQICNRRHTDALARAIQLRNEIRFAGFKLDPLLEEVFYTECRA